MINFTFYTPTRVLFGVGRIKEVGSEIKKSNVKKVLLVAGGGSIKKNGVYDTVIASLQEQGIDWVELWGVVPNPVLSKVMEGISLAKESGVDGVLAVGGGSVIDTAKAIASGIYLDDVWASFLGKEKIKQALPLFVVLTISATGSECNGNFVITNEETKQKLGNHSPLVYPKVSIIDPSVQRTLPWNQTANGACDALSHIMESYFSGGGNETTLYVDEALTKAIIDATDKLMLNEDDLEARANLAWAATLALNGVSAAQLKGDWASHDIEHAISALHPEVAHGAGLAVVFPAWITHVWKENEPTFRRWARNVWDTDDVLTAVERLKSTYKRWGLPISLRELNLEKSEIPAIAQNATQLGKLGTVKELAQEDVEKILEIAY
ncbi:butanol dehydrogenase [Coprothermobacter proteolyticus DSM 5265]|uniref:NADH-dependent butanol dehydrogenase a (Bdh i) n=1 Tax=Coprothermobacter proteolyticus (strain ATCC 35245 / DSM 5265 / OCM 4 / BT) TaxID=309798 RepID=B5Y9G2_COPPD|nr:iron-containing alcohol dehydrogenase [Coprothermobacter proteolyticus]ACI17861.1 butanol dehydrogenase [Coprothermobacter proteolyticus DSM 5265]